MATKILPLDFWWFKIKPGFFIYSNQNVFQFQLTDLHKKNLKSMKDTETDLKSKLSKSEDKVSDLSKVQQDLSKLRSEFETLSKNHLRTTEDLNR